MTNADLKKLLQDLGIEPGRHRSHFKDSGNNIQFNCPFHGESNPSAGIRTDTMIGRCFSCEEAFNLPKLVAHCLGFTKRFRDSEVLDYVKAHEWLEERFGVSFKTYEAKDKVMSLRITDEEEEEEEAGGKRYEMDMLTIAPFRCGKETHEYYYSRGFNDEDVVRFRVGWDKIRKRVVFPAFWEDGALCGLMGRAVLEEKINGELNPEYHKLYNGENMPKYYIYENFPIRESMYPLWLFKPRSVGKGKRAIIVEGYMDAQWMHKQGYPETLSTVNAKMSYDKKRNFSYQIDILKKHGVTEVVLMRDADEAGQKGNAHDYELLKEHFIVKIVKYPKGKKDPQSLHPLQIRTMLKNMTGYATPKLSKLKIVE